MTGQLSGMILAEVDFYIKGLLKYELFGHELWITTTHVGLFLISLILIIFMIIRVSFLTNAPFEVSTADNILYKLQMILFFLPYMIGALLQLDIFHLRQHIPLLKKKKIWATVVYWIIVGCVVPIAMIFVVDCFFSSDYKAKNYAYSLEMNAIREREEETAEGR